MELRAYLNGLSVKEQNDFATRVGTSLGYLRKKISTMESFGAELSIAIERESGGLVPCEITCARADWSYVRGTRQTPAQESEAA